MQVEDAEWREDGSLAERRIFRWKCDVCDVTFRYECKLTLHNAKPIHIRKSKEAKEAAEAEGGPIKPWKRTSEPEKSSYNWRCEVCDLKLPTEKKLDEHLARPSHVKKAD